MVWASASRGAGGDLGEGVLLRAEVAVRGVAETPTPRATSRSATAPEPPAASIGRPAARRLGEEIERIAEVLDEWRARWV